MGKLWEGGPISFFGVIVCTYFVQDRSSHLQKCPSRGSHIRRYKVDNHPLLVSPLCCLTIPIFDLFANARFVRFNILGEEFQCPNDVVDVRRGTHVAR